MRDLQLSVVHRLPHNYRWQADAIKDQVEPLPHNSENGNSNNLIGLKLLNHTGESAWRIMQKLDQHLQEIQVDCAVIEWNKEPCLFVACRDEGVTMYRLINMGVAVAESVVTQ